MHDHTCVSRSILWMLTAFNDHCMLAACCLYIIMSCKLMNTLYYKLMNVYVTDWFATQPILKLADQLRNRPAWITTAMKGNGLLQSWLVGRLWNCLVGRLWNWLDWHKCGSSSLTYLPVILTVHFEIAWLVKTGWINTNAYGWPTYFLICQLIRWSF